MIDLHCHILPGVDDGPRTLEDSLAIARAAAEDGVRTIAATPHSLEGGGEGTGDEAEVRQRVAALQSELASRGVELKLLPGLEVYLTPEAPTLHAQGGIYTLNGSRYMLVEFPPHTVPPFAEQALFELQVRQVVPIIAHPERNSAIAGNLEILERMVNRGMLAQMTAASLVGAFGTRTREVAESMVTRRLVHVIGSDAHSARGRSPSLSAAARRASELIGEEAAQAMVTTLPAAILQDEEVDIPEPQPVQRRFWLPFIRKK